MTMITLPAKLFSAMQVTQAKGDVRYYLNGVLLDVTNQRLVSTDGHRLSVAPCQVLGLDVNTIIGMIDKIPAKASELLLDLETKTATAMLDGLTLGLLRFDVITGNYPDVDRVIPNFKGDLCEHGFNAKYVADIEKQGKALGLKGADNVASYSSAGQGLTYTIKTADHVLTGHIMAIRTK